LISARLAMRTHGCAARRNGARRSLSRCARR
jgi:hypothetical protein